MNENKKENMNQYKNEAIIEGLQQPSILVSASICLLSLGYALVLGPFIGGVGIAFGMSGISGVTTAGLVTWNCVFKNEKYLTQKYIEAECKLKEQLEKDIIDKINSTEKSLASNLLIIKLTNGIKEFKSLKREYDHIANIYVNLDANKSLIDVEKVKKLSQQVYMQGLDMLTLAIEIAKQVSITDCEHLETENAELRAEIAKSKATISQKERLVENERSIKIIDDCCNKIDDLLQQTGLCESLLRKTRLALPELIAHYSKDDIERIAIELGSRIEFAQKLKIEYDKKGL